MITAKFGGTSVADAAAIGRLSAIVAGNAAVKVVVVSALAGITDALLACVGHAGRGDAGAAAAGFGAVRLRHLGLMDDLATGPGTRAQVESELDRLGALLAALAAVSALGAKDTVTPAQQDAVVATGELLSSRIVADALVSRGIPAIWIDARKAVVTDQQFTRAAPLEAETAASLQRVVAPAIREGRIAVVGGFVGATAEGVTTTLGRGGSDYSAALIGALLGADEIHIWTDVDGMLTADPRVVPTVRLVPHLSFAEASELAYFGAKVLHPSTIQPAVARNIPVRILNARRPGGPGTLITASAPSASGALRAIASKRDVTVIDITSTRMLMAHGFLRRVFEVFDRHGAAVDVVTTSEVSLSVTIDDASALDAIVADLGAFADVSYERGLGLVCAVGERLRTDPTLFTRILEALDGLPLRLVSQAGSRQNVTFVVAQRDLAPAMERLHRRFFEGAGTAGAGPAAPHEALAAPEASAVAREESAA